MIKNTTLTICFFMLAFISFSQQQSVDKTDSILVVFSNPQKNNLLELLNNGNKKTPINNETNKPPIDNMPIRKIDITTIEVMPQATPDKSIYYNMPIWSKQTTTLTECIKFIPKKNIDTPK